MALQISLGRWFESASPDAFSSAAKATHSPNNAYSDPFCLPNRNPSCPNLVIYPLPVGQQLALHQTHAYFAYFHLLVNLARCRAMLDD